MRSTLACVVTSGAAWLALAGILGLPARAAAQIGALVSPGPLSRPHAQLEGIANCQKCHEPGRRVTAARCLACHKPIADRIAARKGVHRDAGDQCVGCHAEHAGLDAELRPFDTAQFDHAAWTGFPLDGKHAPFARDCAKCHRTRSFLAVRPECAACHKDPHRGTVGANCQGCHPVTAAFSDARTSFEHSRARFPLLGAHRTVGCARCHVNNTFRGLKFASCGDCHDTPHRAALGSACASCHGNETWKTTRIDHSRTTFPLKGKHAGVPCASCHVRPAARVRVEADRCARCHVDVHKGQFAQDCGACHNETSFAKTAFDHARETKFPLTGRHASLPCERCHKGAAKVAVPARPGSARTVSFAGASSACASCHEDVHRGETSRACETCHGTSNFAVARYDHSQAAGWFFRGQHAAAACASCHGRPPGASVVLDAARSAVSPVTAAAAARAPIRSWRFKSLGTACASCHTDIHGAQFTATCDHCHGVEDRGFRASRFSHAKTAFPLAGRHQTVPCSACHRPGGTSPRLPAPTASGGATLRAPAERPAQVQGLLATAIVFRGTPSACASCHEDVHLAQLGPRCETCHSSETFKLPAYQHRPGALDRFFVGTHRTLGCGACHKAEEHDYPGGRAKAVRYTGIGAACATCHTAEDVHRGALGRSCETCHEPEGWPTVSRAFHKVGPFPLEGRHLSVPCSSCHLEGVTKGTPNQCVDCHWIRRQDDPYQTRLGTQCEQCHRPTSWTAVNWNHAAKTGYALSLAHQVLRCDNCHRNGRFTNTRTDCFGCHESSYRSARNPNHAEAGFPTACDNCHRPVDASWRGAGFNHANYPLVGAHAAQACAACHRDNVYAGTPRACLGCHQDDYQRTQNPNHAAAGFSTGCEACHQASASTWAANFNHNQFFPLLGRHQVQACGACHKGSAYKGTPRDCYPCHQSAYDQTRSPDHRATGFGTACESCHRASDNSWRDGRFTHRFPITSGPHAGRPCSACHVDGTNYRVFSCTTCHGRSETDSEHREVNGYRYDSAACYACHPTGRE